MLTPTVDAPCGPLRGVADPTQGVRAYRGVPYAAPPVGRLRWRPPEQLPRWTTALEAASSAPIAVQTPAPRTSLFANPEERQSEDCLYLNVWAPLDPRERLLPVLVWFHLGAFQYGSGSAPLYDGWRWAQGGAVLVTVNYRLSKLGFLAHPELIDEGAGTAGNYGLRDQIAALQWVQENIEAFGGNPDCVTICGVSSGASSVALLMAAQAARGLFHRAIAESGGAFGPVAPTTGIGDAWQDLESAAESGFAWSASAGAPDLRRLRQLSALTLRTASMPTARQHTGVFDASRPIVDGTLFPVPPHTAFITGAQAPVPLLVGSAADEDLAMFNYPRDLATFRQQARREHGSDSGTFFDLYPAKTDEQAVAAGLRSNGHRLFTWQNWRWANLHSLSGHPVYYYRFAQRPPVPPNSYSEQSLPRTLGAFHGASLFYTFGGAAFPPGWRWTPEHANFAKALRAAWIHFAAHGRPVAENLPDWPEFDAARPDLMILRADGSSLGPLPERPHLAFWDNFYRNRLSKRENGE
jgi:para-nitrobenzyl esterase